MRSKWARRSGPRRRPGTHDAWAFGGTNSGGGSLPVGRPVAEHRASGKWRSSQLPSGLKGYISEVSAPSASDIWAITFLGGYILHWNGAHWSLSKHLTGAGELTGVTAFSAKNVWVFGGGGFIGGLGTWHFNGTSWTRQAAASADGLERASALSPRDIWAVGGSNSPDSAIFRYNGSRWTAVSTCHFRFQRVGLGEQRRT